MSSYSVQVSVTAVLKKRTRKTFIERRDAAKIGSGSGRLLLGYRLGV